MTDELKLELLECFQWDREAIDGIRADRRWNAATQAYEGPSERAAGLLQAIREHLDRYTELLNNGC